ncbi:MAG: Molybdopterin synthase catalytic subunit [Chrysothrix sp. TS-e1954]|nr:MAG: Molybdopterin synthase catalytic subunit [Chrysothrix sp. TS-e1954]
MPSPFPPSTSTTTSPSPSSPSPSTRGIIAHPPGNPHTYTLASPPSHTHVLLTHEPLHLPPLQALLSHPTAGATVLFTGQTRSDLQPSPHSTNPTPTKTTTSLTYTTYPALALRSLSRIAARTTSNHPGVHGVVLAHRLGRCGIGEVSVVVGVSAGHRSEAFEGCEAALEGVKREVEIWKWEEFGREGGGGGRGGGGGGDEEGGGGDGDGVWRVNFPGRDGREKEVGGDGVG